jgi:hypothetical protein
MLRNLKLLLNRCLLLSSMVFQATTVFAFEYQSMKFEDVQFEVIKVDDLKDLQLFLKILEQVISIKSFRIFKAT